MDESETDQILAIDELRALRDRMSADAATPGAVTNAAPVEAPDPLAAIPPEVRDDPWEELRRQARDRRHWGRLVAAGGGLAVAGAAVALLVFSAHNRSVAPSGVTVPAPTVSAVPVSPAAPAAVSSAAQPSAVLPVPVVPGPTTSAEEVAGPGAAAVPEPPAPPATHRRKPPGSVAPPASGPSPAMPAGGPVPGAAPDRAGAPSGPAGSSCDAGCTDPTLTRTPTSWSPVSPP
ncbi:MAG: hypothetical protein JO287_10635 [Pseudonocardiales bacterium]|nr:hypothetical protein [Pseudonocardiales bacterium]